MISDQDDASSYPFSPQTNKWLTVLLIITLMALFTCLDWITPREIHFQVFFGIPVALCAWVFGAFTSVPLAFFSVFIGVWILLKEGGHYTSRLEMDWDVFTRVTAFLVLIAVIRRFRKTYDAERRARLASDEATKLKTDLMALLSHELGNTALVINSSLYELASDPSPSTADRQECFEAIDQAAKALSETSHNFLNSAALESGRLIIRKQPVSIQELLSTLQTRFRLLMEQKGLSLRFEAVPLVVEADEAALRLILINLIGNAAKYTRSPGKITVSVQKTKSGIHFAVEDTGIGIAPEDLDKIRRSFYRSESGRRMAKGFGLGLTIVEGLLKAHGSYLSIDSQPGHGSCFSFDLPATVPAPASRL